MNFIIFHIIPKLSSPIRVGITEETTVMDIPCITLRDNTERDNTERPETCTIGSNELTGTNPSNIKPALDKLFAGKWKKRRYPSFVGRQSSRKNRKETN